jgi:hypothetical protein
VRLFLTMKNGDVARSLGVRRLRRAPGCGQRFEIAVDGRPLRARIMRFSGISERLREAMVPDRPRAFRVVLGGPAHDV